MATQQDIGTDALLMRMRFFEDEHDDLVHSWSGQKYTPKAVGFEEIERAVRMPRLLVATAGRITDFVVGGTEWYGLATDAYFVRAEYKRSRGHLRLCADTTASSSRRPAS
jgi:hypothetical protein